MELVEHHVKEEEATMFKMARELFDQKDLDALGARMERMKQTAA
jgi:hypothetical protein